MLLLLISCQPVARKPNIAAIHALVLLSDGNLLIQKPMNISLNRRSPMARSFIGGLGFGCLLLSTGWALALTWSRWGATAILLRKLDPPGLGLSPGLDKRYVLTREVN